MKFTLFDCFKKESTNHNGYDVQPKTLIVDNTTTAKNCLKGNFSQVIKLELCGLSDKEFIPIFQKLQTDNAALQEISCQDITCNDQFYEEFQQLLVKDKSTLEALTLDSCNLNCARLEKVFKGLEGATQLKKFTLMNEPTFANTDVERKEMRTLLSNNLSGINTLQLQNIGFTTDEEQDLRRSLELKSGAAELN